MSRSVQRQQRRLMTFASEPAGALIVHNLFVIVSKRYYRNSRLIGLADEPASTPSGAATDAKQPQPSIGASCEHEIGASCEHEVARSRAAAGEEAQLYRRRSEDVPRSDGGDGGDINVGGGDDGCDGSDGGSDEEQRPVDERTAPLRPAGNLSTPP
jgi:hypothetical protein